MLKAAKPHGRTASVSPRCDAGVEADTSWKTRIGELIAQSARRQLDGVYTHLAPFLL
jgi:hypothetical protein